MRYVLSLLAAALVAASVSAQCSGPNCQLPARVVDEPAMRLVRVPGEDQYGVYLRGRQVGTFDAAAKRFRPYDEKADRWGAEVALDPAGWGDGKCKCVACKCTHEPIGQTWQESGVDAGRLRESRYVVNGREVSQGDALRAISDTIPDESKKLSVTVIGGKADRDKVAADLRGLDAATSARVNVWSAPPDHHSLQDTETGRAVAKVDGKPTIYVQAPDGKVLHRQDDAAGSVDAIRKAVKSYDAAKDPDLRKAADPANPAAPSTSMIPLCCVAAAVALTLYMRKSS